IWPRRIVRETRLLTPFPVKDIHGNRLITGSDSFKLAGVILPTNAHDLDSAETFIRLATAQGVEVIRQVSPSSCMIRCEPRILHSHSDYRVEAHFEQHNLNELILALGYASFDPDEKGLTDLERHRLAAAHTAAQMQQWGIWETAKSHYGERVSEEGIYQSSISILNLVFKLALQESETRNKPKP
ncbi:MAG: hypothetical protein OJI67_06470, partial [Prosthecobacter sp.]|nr:hypothetical protein [Prosthecobacter sp.]